MALKVRQSDQINDKIKINNRQVKTKLHDYTVQPIIARQIIKK